MLLEKMQYCRKDVREFADQEYTSLSLFEEKAYLRKLELKALVLEADGFADFTDVDVEQL